LAVRSIFPLKGWGGRGKIFEGVNSPMFWAIVGTVNIPAIATINAVVRAVTNGHQPFFQKDAENNFISNKIDKGCWVN
jgi:hypothetical protein